MKLKYLLFVIVAVAFSGCSPDDDGIPVNAFDGIRIKSTTIQDLVNGQWVDYYKITNTFEGDNLHMSSSLSQEFDTGSQSWKDDRLTTYTLLDSDHADTQLQQQWDNGSLSWINDVKNDFEYNN